MEINLYDILSNILLATINSYVYFVLVFHFNWNKRRYRQRGFAVIYVLLCYAIGLVRRFALWNFATQIPIISIWEPILSLLDLFLLWYCFDSALWKSLLLVLCHSGGYTLSYLAIKSWLTKLTDMTLAEGFPFQARFMHEMTLIAMAILTFYMGVILAGAIRRSKQPPRLLPRHVFGVLLPTILYILGYIFIFPYMVGIENSDFPFLIGTILFVVNVATWLVYIDLDRKNVHLYYLEKHYEEQELYFAKIKKGNKNAQKRMHDERKHYIHIMGLLQQKEYDRLGEYLTSLTEGASGLKNLVITGNQDMDTVLNAKMGEAEAAGCCIAVTGKLPLRLGIDPVDSCILLGNCLDNAIRACRETDDHEIRVDFSYYKHMLFIRVRNAYIPFRFLESSQLGGRAGPRGGMGLEIMESVAKKYGGELKIICKKNVFTTEIFLRNVSAPQRRIKTDGPANPARDGVGLL